MGALLILPSESKAVSKDLAFPLRPPLATLMAALVAVAGAGAKGIVLLKLAHDPPGIKRPQATRPAGEWRETAERSTLPSIAAPSRRACSVEFKRFPVVRAPRPCVRAQQFPQS